MHLAETRAILDTFPPETDQRLAILEPDRPTWRELWLDTIHEAKRASVLSRATAAPEGIDRLPSWSRADEAVRRLRTIDARVCQPWELPDPDLFRLDAAALMAMTLFRLGSALALFEAERGALPARLEELVPRHLPSIPPCPLTGKPLRYEAGRLWSDAAPLDPDSGYYKAADLVFEVRPRS